MPSQYGELGPLAAQICWRVWGTLQISSFGSCQHYCTAL